MPISILIFFNIHDTFVLTVSTFQSVNNKFNKQLNNNVPFPQKNPLFFSIVTDFKTFFCFPLSYFVVVN